MIYRSSGFVQTRRFAPLLVSLWIAAISAPLADGAIVDSMRASPRVFNDFSTSTVTITNNYPSQVIIDDRNLTDDGMGGNFANRHDVLFSGDGGATAATFNINDAFAFEARVRLDAGSNAPRKEAGLRFNSSVTSDALFIINSDAGEIVAFGGGAPTHSFGNNGTGDGYTPGTTILMGLIYRGDTTPRTVEFYIDRDPSTPTGIETTGPRDWANNENGPVNFTVGLYAQVTPTDSNDFIRATFTNIVIPEPSIGALLGAGLLLSGRSARRRACKASRQ